VPASFVASANDCEDHGREIHKRAARGDFGPVAEYEPPPPPSDELLAKRARAHRYIILNKTDYTQMPDADLSDEAKAAWKKYRQALRDISDQGGFPRNIDWPESPDGKMKDPVDDY